MKEQFRSKLCLVVAPTGQAGGGMGRVKDYIIEGGHSVSGLQFRSLVTRDQRGVTASIGLMLKAVLAIWSARLSGTLGLVHVNMGDRGSAVRKGLVVLLARAVGAKVVLHLHAVELHERYRQAGPLLRAVIKGPFRSATCNVVLGEFWRQWLVRDLGIAADRVEVVWNGVPVEVSPGRDLAYDTPPVRLLFLGNLIDRKGVGDLLHALADLPPGIPNWHLTLAGGGDVERFSSMAAELGLAEQTRFLGWVDTARARDLLARSHGLVLPSYHEGLPLVILEALGSGTPVICTPVGAIPEVLADGDTALFCLQGDRVSLTSALARLIRNPALRQSISDRGLAEFAQRFSLPAFMAALIEVYRRHCGLLVRYEGQRESR